MQARVTQQRGTNGCARPQVVRCVASAHSNGHTAKPVHIIGISGSLRKKSVNAGMLNTMAKHVPANATIEMVSIADLPHYNDDLWEGLDEKDDDSALPAPIRDFRSKVDQADGVIFASPEYNFSISGPLKNAIDWASKGPNLWRHKVCTVVTAAGSQSGARGVQALEGILASLGVQFLPPRPNHPMKFVFAGAFGPAFNRDTGEVVDPKLEQYLANEVISMAEWAPKYQQLYADPHVPDVDEEVTSEPVIIDAAASNN